MASSPVTRRSLLLAAAAAVVAGCGSAPPEPSVSTPEPQGPRRSPINSLDGFSPEQIEQARAELLRAVVAAKQALLVPGALDAVVHVDYATATEGQPPPVAPEPGNPQALECGRTEPVQFVALHHTDAASTGDPIADFRAVRIAQMTRPQGPYGDFAYNAAVGVDTSGPTPRVVIIDGRPTAFLPSHSRGMNNRALAVASLDDWDAGLPENLELHMTGLFVALMLACRRYNIDPTARIVIPPDVEGDLPYEIGGLAPHSEIDFREGGSRGEGGNICPGLLVLVMNELALGTRELLTDRTFLSALDNFGSERWRPLEPGLPYAPGQGPFQVLEICPPASLI